MSAPHVAGLAALVIQKYPELSSEEVKYLIKGSSIDLGYPLHHQGVGRIDVPRTLFNGSTPRIIDAGCFHVLGFLGLDLGSCWDAVVGAANGHRKDCTGEY